jgi:hypothetical protein
MQLHTVTVAVTKMDAWHVDICDENVCGISWYIWTYAGRPSSVEHEIKSSFASETGQLPADHVVWMIHTI